MEVLKLVYEKWCKIPDKIRFLFIGGVNAAISYIIFAIAVYLLGQGHYQLCVILQWTISSVFSYFNQKFLYKGKLFTRIFEMLFYLGGKLFYKRNYIGTIG